MKDIFHSPKRSIARGEHHVEDFARQLDVFLSTEPYSIVVEQEPDTGDYVQKVKSDKPFPDDLEQIAADAITNLRNALDQMMFAIGGKGSYFPGGGNSPTDFENAIRGRCKKIPVEIVKVIRGFKPYRGGDDHLWALNELANTNKHGIFIPCITELGKIIGVWDDPAKHEMELSRFRVSSAQLQSNIGVAFYVSFGGIPEIQGTPADEILQTFVLSVDEVLLSVETCHLGLTPLI